MPQVEIVCTEGRTIRPLRLTLDGSGEVLSLVEWSPVQASANQWVGEVTAADGRRFHLAYRRGGGGWQVREL